MNMKKLLHVALNNNQVKCRRSLQWCIVMCRILIRGMRLLGSLCRVMSYYYVHTCSSTVPSTCKRGLHRGKESSQKPRKREQEIFMIRMPTRIHTWFE